MLELVTLNTCPNIKMYLITESPVSLLLNGNHLCFFLSIPSSQLFEAIKSSYHKMKHGFKFNPQNLFSAIPHRDGEECCPWAHCTLNRLSELLAISIHQPGIMLTPCSLPLSVAFFFLFSTLIPSLLSPHREASLSQNNTRILYW